MKFDEFELLEKLEESAETWSARIRHRASGEEFFIHFLKANPAEPLPPALFTQAQSLLSWCPEEVRMVDTHGSKFFVVTAPHPHLLPFTAYVRLRQERQFQQVITPAPPQDEIAALFHWQPPEGRNPNATTEFYVEETRKVLKDQMRAALRRLKG